MTTILISAKHNKIVADKQTTSRSWSTYDKGSFGYDYVENNKLHKVCDSIFTGCGDRDEIERQLKEYSIAQHLKTPKEDCTIVIVHKKGEGLIVDIYETKQYRSWTMRKKYKWKHTREHGEDVLVTLGSGGQYAFGAYKAGVSPEEAVRVASKCCEYTSFEQDVVEM